jgi:hypothetical protein
MSSQIIDPTPTPRQFSDLAIGDTCWVVIIGQAVEVEKIGFQSGRKLSGRKGKTWISPNRTVYDTEAEAAAGLERMLDYGRRIREQRAALAGGAA